MARRHEQSAQLRETVSHRSIEPDCDSQLDCQKKNCEGLHALRRINGKRKVPPGTRGGFFVPETQSVIE